ncbi:MAG TPA: trypsin-like peptidase domain-containing protein [Gemmataceae bacterium]|jgi:S1-C subfamily serine protease|nr:trypsin-like peptidase domain-containing protein [Gemmataceae bacterium]
MPSYEDYGFPGRPRRHREAPPLAGTIVVLLLILGAGLVIGYFAFRGLRNPTHDADAGLRPVTPRGDRDAFEQERIRVFKDTSPSVVNVDTLRIQREGYIGLSEQQQGTGSGFVWDDQGRVVTNFHVIANALQVTTQGGVTIKPSATVRVTLADQSAWNARLVGVAPDNDLAVVQIDAPAERLKPIAVGSSGDLEVGQTVYAIGNPFGRSLTFTHGIISALDREIQSITDRPISGVIQTDAPLNPGNSGGPMLDREGRLIGVNTAITSPSGGSVGLGYAIPVDTVNPVVTQLIRSGRAPRPALGVRLLRESDTRALGHERGVMIAEVVPGGAAAKAGLRGFRESRAAGGPEEGDLILGVDGEPITGIADFQRVMSKLKVQQTIQLTIRRGGQDRQVSVTLEGL